MTYQDQLEQTVSATAAQVLAALAMYQAAKLTEEAFLAVVVAYLQAGNAAAASLADLSLAAVLTQATGEPIAPLGVATDHALDDDRLRKATSTMLALPDASTARWERLARAEGQEAAARAYSAGIRESRHVTGWTRGLSANACQLCQWWSRDGKVWPEDHEMPTHKGCTCNPVPVTQ